MASRLLIGDNNLSKFWPAYQFGKPALKSVLLVTATDFDTIDNALSQSDDKDQVIVSVLTTLLIEELNQLELTSSASNILDQLLSRLLGLCPRSPSCQVLVVFSFFETEMLLFFHLVTLFCYSLVILLLVLRTHCYFMFSP